MSRRMLRLSLAMASVVLLLALASARAAAIPAPADLLAMVPGVVSFEHEIRPIDYFRLKDGSGASIGAAFVTSSVPPAISGYGGEIDVLVGIDRDGRITGTKLLEHHESPQFMQRVIDAGLFSRFLGRKAGDDFRDIEAVSGATISSQAIIRDVQTSAAAVAAALAGAKPTSAASGGSVLRFLPTAAVLLLMACAVAAALLPSRRWLRAATLVLAAGVIGLWLNTPITIGDLVDVRNAGLAWSAKSPVLLLIAFATVAALLRGNLYCSYLCPFGALQEGCARVLPHKCRPEDRVSKAAGWLRWIVTLVAIFAIAQTGSFAFRTIEPFALCFMRPPEMSALLQAGVVLAVGLVVRRAWCRFFCPTGLVFDLAALLGAKARREIYRLLKRRSASSRGHE